MKDSFKLAGVNAESITSRRPLQSSTMGRQDRSLAQPYKKGSQQDILEDSLQIRNRELIGDNALGLEALPHSQYFKIQLVEEIVVNCFQ